MSQVSSLYKIIVMMMRGKQNVDYVKESSRRL